MLRLNRHCQPHRTRLAASILILTAASASAQQIPSPSDHELHPIWGGQNQAVHTTQVGDGTRTIIGTGGGALRVSDPTINGGAWRYANTPQKYTGTIIDIEFLKDNPEIGFACGRTGLILKTVNGGQDWNIINHVNSQGTAYLLDPCDDPATLWSICPITENVLIAVGLWYCKFSPNGGVSWFDVDLREATGSTGGPLGLYGGNQLAPSEFHFYSVDVVGGLGTFRGAISGEWESPTGSRGVVFHSNAAEAGAGSGIRWRMTLDDGASQPANGGGSTLPGAMVEPWALAFQRDANPSTPGSAVGYVVGSKANTVLPTGISGRVYRTDDGGNSWSHAGDTTAGSFGVAVEANQAMIATYGGQYYTHVTGATGLTAGTISTNSFPISPGFSTVANNVADSSKPGHYIFGGGFGLTLETQDFGQSWTSINPHNDLPELWEQRITAGDALNSSVAIAGGQFNSIMKTTNGGDDWTLVYPSTITTAGFIRDISYTSLGFAVAVGDDETALVSLDQGSTWSTASVLDAGGAPSTTAYTLSDVHMKGFGLGWCVGYLPGPGSSTSPNSVILQTSNFGFTWTKTNIPVDPTVRLTGVYFPEPGKGIVVGWSTNSTSAPYVAEARAFVTLNSSTTWNPLSIANPIATASNPQPSRKLLAISGKGSNLATATALAVGNGGMVLSWNGSTLVDVPGVYDYDESGTSGSNPNYGGVNSRMLAADLGAVGFSPSGGTVLIGGQTDINLQNAADFGWMLKQSGGSWSKVKANTSKGIKSISLTDDSNGLVIGHTLDSHNDGLGYRLDHCDGYSDGDVQGEDFNNPNLADSIILLFGKPK